MIGSIMPNGARAAFLDVLGDYGFHMELGYSVAFVGEGDCTKEADRKSFVICDKNGARMGCAVLNWRTCEEAPS